MSKKSFNPFKRFAIKYEEGVMTAEKEAAATNNLEEQLSHQELTSLPMHGIKLGIGKFLVYHTVD